MKLDAKFYGEIRKVKDGTVVPDDEYVVFQGLNQVSQRVRQSDF